MSINAGKIEFINIPELFDMKVVKGIDVSHNFKKHLHKTYNIGIITNGKVKLKVNNTEYVIHQDEVFLINPNNPHELRAYDNITYSHSVLCLNDEDFYNNSLQFSEVKISERHLCEEVKNSFDIILNQSKSLFEKENYITLLIDKILMEENKSIKRNYNIRDDNIYLIEKVKEYINDNWKEDISLNDLSKAVNMSKFHLSRVFKKVVGLSPYDYYLQLKIKKVQNLLECNHNIAEIVYETGFYDQSHLNKYFKKFVGISPYEYVKNYKKI